MSIPSLRKVLVLIAGVAVTLAGVVMLVTPGPAFLVIPAGLAILASRFQWAHRLLQRVLSRIRSGPAGPGANAPTSENSL